MYGNNLIFLLKKTKTKMWKQLDSIEFDKTKNQKKKLIQI